MVTMPLFVDDTFLFAVIIAIVLFGVFFTLFIVSKLKKED